MKQTYTLKKKLIPDDLKSLDADKREKIEEILGRKLNDYQWDVYKKMTMDKQKN